MESTFMEVVHLAAHFLIK